MTISAKGLPIVHQIKGKQELRVRIGLANWTEVFILSTALAGRIAPLEGAC